MKEIYKKQETFYSKQNFIIKNFFKKKRDHQSAKDYVEETTLKATYNKN